VWRQRSLFRVACLLAAADIAGIVVLALGPTASRPAAMTGVAPVAGGGRAQRSNVGGHPVAPTTTAPPATTVPAPVVTTPPAPVTTAPPAAPPPVSTPAPRPAATVPAPATGHPILPPYNPPANIPPQPDILAACSSTTYDDSPRCVSSSLAAIDNARRPEGLPAMALPGNWTQLTPAEQLFVVTDLERTARGLAPLSAMATAPDESALAGADAGVDPSPPAGFPFSQWAANWAGGMGNPLEAIYFWMYDDGPGSSNLDCTPGNESGCWGHRDKVLMALSCRPCVMGAGFAPGGWRGGPSWAELLIDTAGAPASVFTWQQELGYL
jgi:hypothetical protein